MKAPTHVVPATLPVYAYFHSESEAKPVARKVLVVAWELYKLGKDHQEWHAVVLGGSPYTDAESTLNLNRKSGRAPNYVGVFEEIKRGKAACLAAIKSKAPQEEDPDA